MRHRNKLHHTGLEWGMSFCNLLLIICNGVIRNHTEAVSTENTIIVIVVISIVVKTAILSTAVSTFMMMVWVLFVMMMMMMVLPLLFTVVKEVICTTVIIIMITAEAVLNTIFIQIGTTTILKRLCKLSASVGTSTTLIAS